MSADNLLSSEPGKDLLVKLCKVMSRKLDASLEPTKVLKEVADPETGEVVEKWLPNPDYVNMPASEMAAIIKLLSDNSITLAAIKRGEFGETAQRANEEFPTFDTPAGLQ